MTKYELVKAVSINTKVDEETTSKIIEETFQTIASVLEKGDRIQIPFFGTFYTKTRNGRTTKLNGKQIKIPSKRVVAFQVSKALKQKVETNIV